MKLVKHMTLSELDELEKETKFQKAAVLAKMYGTPIDIDSIELPKPVSGEAFCGNYRRLNNIDIVLHQIQIARRMIKEADPNKGDTLAAIKGWTPAKKKRYSNRGWSERDMPYWKHDCDECQFLTCIQLQYFDRGKIKYHYIDVYKNCSPDEGLSDYILRFSSDPPNYQTTGLVSLIARATFFSKGLTG